MEVSCRICWNDIIIAVAARHLEYASGWHREPMQKEYSKSLEFLKVPKTCQNHLTQLHRCAIIEM